MREFKGKLRCGVVGLGVGKRRHIEGYRTHPNAEVVAIADLDPARLEDVGNAYGIDKRYPTLTDMLRHEKLDVISIATPNKLHMPQTVEALEAGCHVLCEKPMALTEKDGLKMIEASKRTGKRVMINFSTRISPEAYAIKRAVDAGTLGDIYFARSIWMRRRRLPGFGGWFGKKELSGGGPLIDIGVHRLDLAIWLMNFPKPTWVMGATYDPIAQEIARKEGKEYDVEDLAVAMIKFENGATLELEASWCSHIKEREHVSTRLLGTKGGILHHNIGDVYDSFADIYLEKDGCQYDMRLHPPVPDVHVNMYNLIEAIIKDKPHDCTPEQGLYNMRILDAIYKSAETNKPVRIKS